MTREELPAVVEGHGYFIDWALMFHGYRSYMRDYDVVMFNPFRSDHKGTYSALLKHCVEVDIRSAMQPDFWSVSLDDRLTTYDGFQELVESGEYNDEMVWHLGWSVLYPGWFISATSTRADYWSQSIGIEFHEIRIESNAYVITAIFSDLIVSKLADGDEDPLVNDVPTWLARYTNT